METINLLKHKEVVSWWLQNPCKGVWAQYKLYDIDNTYTWELQSQPDWEAEVYIQNDEYAELRKALVEGKVVQLDNSHVYNTRAVKSWIKVDNIHTHIPISHYRIKQKEPKFKVGDWVRNKSSDVIIQAHENMNSKNFELWEPKDGEYVLCSNRNQTEFTLKQFFKRDKEYWDNIVPLEFIETLKDKQWRM